MREVIHRYRRVIAALAVIFVCGQGIGYAIATKFLRPSPSVTAALEGDGADLQAQARARAEWMRRAAESLDRTLTLAPEQRGAVERVLERKAEQIWQERDRALFQIRLYLLEAHDEISDELDEGQREQLAESRERLEREIRDKFPSILNGGLE